MLNFYSVLPFILFNSFGAEVLNPCPNILKYVHMSELSQLRAIIQLQSKEDLEGIFLKIKFNYNELLALSSDFGKFTKDSTTSFTLVNSSFELKANVIRPIQVKISYNATIGVPIITSINLNGRLICNEDNTKPKPVQDNKTIQCRSGKVPNTLASGEVEKGHYQWLAAIYVNDSNVLEYKCVGTLVNKQFVITTALCFFEAVDKEGLQLVVYFGKQYGENLTSPGLQVRNVRYVKFHGSFIDRYNDIAVLKLDKPIDYTDYVYPICLWDNDPNEKIYQPGVVVGWEVDSEKRTKELKMFQTYIIDKEDCIDLDPDALKNYYRNNIYCGGFMNYTLKQFPCVGSAGSSMIFKKPNSDPENPTWMLRGIFSVRGKEKCSTDSIALFLDIAKYYQWIFEAITEDVGL